jgi:dsRNA-specific ribonuclease
MHWPECLHIVNGQSQVIQPIFHFIITFSRHSTPSFDCSQHFLKTICEMRTLKELSVVLKPFIGVENGMEQLKWMLHPWLTLETLPEKPERFYALPASQVPIWHPPQMMLMGSSVIEMVLVQLTCQSLPQDAIEKVKESIAFGNSVDSFSRVGVLLGLDNYLNWAHPGLQHVRVEADPVVENVLQTMPINVDNRQKFKVRQDEFVIAQIVCCLVGAVACQAGLEDAIRLARRCWSQIFVERVQIQAREAYNPDQALKLVFESKVLVSHPKKRVKTQRIPISDHRCKLHMVGPTQPLDVVQVMEAVESPVSPFDIQLQAVHQSVQPAIHQCVQPDVHQTVQSAIHQPAHPAIHVQASSDSIPIDPRFASPTAPSFPLSLYNDARIPTDPRLTDAPRVSAVGNIHQMAFKFAESDPQVIQSMAEHAHSIAGPTDPRLHMDQTTQPNAPTESDKPPEGPGNSKGKLKIVVDKEKWSNPVYTVHKTGPPHKPIFTCEGNLSLPNGEEIIVSSTGQTRKASEQWAATAILQQLERLGKISLPLL